VEPLLTPLVDSEVGAPARDSFDSWRSRIKDTLASGLFEL
jgi:hypothetical protein